MVPTLFSMLFSAMLKDAFNNEDPGVGIRYWNDRKLFNLRHLKAVAKVKTNIIRDLLFADDCAPIANSEPEMHQNLDNFG